jgi:hypothetical protein
VRRATSAHTASLTQREEIAEGAMAIHFAKPADFQFGAGQSMDLTLLNPPETDAEGNSQAFSNGTIPCLFRPVPLKQIYLYLSTHWMQDL